MIVGVDRAKPRAGAPVWQRYALAVSAVGVAWTGRLLLSPVLGATGRPYLLCFPAIAAAAWFGGVGPGLLAICLSILTAGPFFFPASERFGPGGLLPLGSSSDTIGSLAFVLGSVFIVGAFGAMHRARARLVEDVSRRLLAERELAAGRDLLTTTLASIGDGVIVTDGLGRITFLNAEAERLTGWSFSEAAARPLSEVFRILNEQTREPVENPVQKVLRLGIVQGLANHTVLVTRDGTETPIGDSGAPIREPGGPILGVVLVFHDVTLERQAMDDKTRLAAIVEFSGDAIFTKNIEGIVQTWNLSAQRLFGYEPEEIVGQPITKLVPSERLDEETEILERLRRGVPSERLETVRIAKGGRRIPVSLSVSPLRNAEGMVVGASKIVHDISAEKAAEERLREADRHKDRFLAILSHELRNPLSPILTAVSLLGRTGSQDPDLIRLRDIIDRQARHLARLLDDLLDVSRIASGKIVLRPERIDLGQAIASAVETVRPLIDEKKQQLEPSVPEDAIEMQGDKVRISQIFVNLLHNAAKFTGEGGRISLELERAGNEAVVRVRDTGVGIAAEHLANVFEMFAQADQALERGQRGLGVGLSLARTLVELHEGRIDARSGGPGAGAEFIVRLPVLAAKDAAAPAREAPSRSASGRRFRILIADDNVDSATTLETALRLAGHELRIAHDGLEAVERAAAFRPEIAILDIGMPGLNGYDAAKRMRETLGNEVLLVALTGWGQEENKRTAMAAGFDHHVTKPVDIATLEALLEGLTRDRVTDPSRPRGDSG